MARFVIDACITAGLAVALAGMSTGCGNGGRGGKPTPLFAAGQVDEGDVSEAVVLRSDDVGESWSIVGTQRFLPPVTLRLFDDPGGGVLSGTWFFRTEDGGQTWQLLSSGASVPPIDNLEGGLVLPPARDAFRGAYARRLAIL